ncbi:MAG: polysaccharide deacetylase family protein [Candidatus Daviesbacteria bacterium]|nr:polysaccharide deacetylase family protein [Candidatus Daviesbacteria bacterium]
MYLNLIFHRLVENDKDIRNIYELNVNQFIEIVNLVRKLSSNQNCSFDSYRLYFDDGDDSFVSVALQHIPDKELSNCVLAIPTDNINKEGFLSAKDLIFLKRRGVKISSHSVSHSALAFYIGQTTQPTPKGGIYKTAPFGHTKILTSQEILFQMCESKKILINIIGKVSEFVLPHGCYNDDVLSINNKNKIYQIISTCDNFLDDGSSLRPRILIRFDMTVSEFQNLISELHPLKQKI